MMTDPLLAGRYVRFLDERDRGARGERARTPR